MYESAAALRAALVKSGLLRPLSSDGLYGRSATFERVVDDLRRAVTRAGAHLDADSVWFPPVMPREAYERTGYPTTFPDLAGVISTFDGGNREHAEMIGGGDWTSHFAASDVVLCSAPCHPLYETLAGTLDAPRHVELEAPAFRHEPSLDPMRMQLFRTREFVYVGTADGALAFRDDWVRRGLDLLSSLGLEPASEIATDPFFGRLGRLLASSQRETELKVEFTIKATAEGTTAVGSANYHLDHFGTPFGITCADAPAHTACVGFGLDRIAIALFARHGLDPDEWPVREALG